MKVIFTFLLSALFLFSFAQQSFRKSYGAPSYGEYANGTIKLKDGTFLITGSRNFGVGNSDAYCIRMDDNGKTLWAKTFGDSSYNTSAKATATADGNFVLCFTSYAYNSLSGYKYRGMFVVKCNTDGQVLWTKSIKSPSLSKGSVNITPYQVYESKVGDIYIFSDWFSFDYDADYSLTKLDANGIFKWNNSVSLVFTFYNQFSPVQITESDNGDILVGENLDADDFYTFDDEIHISLYSQQTGTEILSRTIYQDYNNGYGYLSAYNLTIKNNTLIVSGTYGHDYEGYGNSWFALQPNDKEVTVFYDLYDNNVSRSADSAIHQIQQKRSLASGPNSTADGGYIYAYSSNYPDYDIVVVKQDSLGRVCTDTAISYSSSPHIQRTTCQVYSDRDRLLSYIFVGADTTITVTNVDAEKTLCESFATPLITLADKTTNAIANNTSHAGLQLYPNPATDRITVTFEAAQPSAIQVNVITMEGRTVLIQKASVGKGKQQVLLNVKSLSPGMYYIMLNGLSQTKVLRFLKQ